MVEKKLTEKQQEYWKKNIGLIRILLIIWALVSYVGGIILAVPFSRIPFFGVNLAFWLAQQGSILVFIALIVIYAVRMDKLDKEYDFHEIKITDQKKGVSA
ncbi:DUF4212 domain-containing protein [Metallumcola ferriviriculae]|uniref:DUF4212 domain-containing protein n=1 Tax=Metallumcola ferriviriculae TaxID=3039180 RepID=A0AAU0UTD2_9FIRM|nr:DUF4212 domain-containing protein [Desulfitibacteraceae bacterium MK1]